MARDGGTLLLVGAGLLQLRAIEIAHDLGLRVAATDMNPNAVGFETADEHYVIDTKDVDGHVQLARELHQRGDLAPRVSASDHQSGSPLAQLAVELGEAVEEKLRARPGGVAAPQERWVEAEDGNHALVL